MLDLITAKRNKIQKLRQEIALLECDIEKLKLTEEYDVRFNIWYKTEDGEFFFRPRGIDNGRAVGLSINLRENELAYELDDDTFGLENSFLKMQVSSYGEMLNAVNLHNLEILEQYK